MNVKFSAHSSWCWTFLVICACGDVGAQTDGIYVYGRVRILDPTLQQDSVLVVIADTVDRDTSFLFARAPKFKYECHLPYGSVYQLSFSMPQHFSEQLVFDATEVPADERIGGYGMNAEINLIPRIQGTDSSLFAPLRATARYDQAARSFSWITDHRSRSGRDKLRQQCQVIIDQKLSAARLEGQSDSLGVLYPSIPLWGKSQEDFVPEHWKIFASDVGDLNGDGLLDLAIAMEFQDSVKHVRPGGTTSLTRPRTLLIVLGAGQGHYKALIRNNDFLIRSDEDPGAPPELDLEISDARCLTLRYQFQQGKAWFTFALAQDQLECVAYEGARANTEGDITFTAFSIRDKRLTLRQGHNEKSGWVQEQEQPLPPDLNLSMQALGRPFQTELRPGIFF